MSLRILFADDSMTAQNMGKKILTEAGYDVVAVSNGAAAVKKIAEHKPDIIILDVYMPGYSGLEVCEKVRASIDTLKTPVLLTVGKMEPYKPEDANRVKADGVIIKPFEASDLLAIVKKLEERIVPSAVPPLVQQTIRLECPPDFSEFAVHSGNSASVSVAAVAAPTPEELDENTVQPTVDVPDHMATVSAFSDLLGTDMLAPVEFSEPVASERQVEIAPIVVSPDLSSTFTSIPQIESVPAIDSTFEVSPSQQWESSAGLHADFAVTPEPAPASETAQQAGTATVFEPVATQSIGVESAEAASAEVDEVISPASPPQPSAAVNSDGVYPDTQPIPVYEEPEPPVTQVNLDDVRGESAPADLTENVSAQRDPAFEPFQAEAAAETSVRSEPGLEPTIQEQSNVAPTADPNLVTERAALESFPTTFGVQNPEEIPVGIASELPPFDAAPPDVQKNDVQKNDEPKNDVQKNDVQTTVEAGAIETHDAVAEPPASVPAPAEDDFEARVAAAMNLYAEPAEAETERAQEAESDQAQSGSVATPEDDFEARVAAAMSAYEEPQSPAAFADEMPPPARETTEAALPAQPQPVVEPQIESLPAFQTEVEAPPVHDEPVAVASEEPASFEYSPPVTASRFYPEPQISPEPHIESTAALHAEVVAEQVDHLQANRFAEMVQNGPAPYAQTAADQTARDVTDDSPSETSSPEAPQASTQQIADSIEAEMPVAAVTAAAVATGADSEAIAQVVHRVMERIKPELIAAIVRELNSQK